MLKIKTVDGEVHEFETIEYFFDGELFVVHTTHNKLYKFIVRNMIYYKVEL